MSVESPKAFPKSELRHNSSLTQGAWGSATDYLFRFDSHWECVFGGAAIFALLCCHSPGPRSATLVYGIVLLNGLRDSLG